MRWPSTDGGSAPVMACACTTNGMAASDAAMRSVARRSFMVLRRYVDAGVEDGFYARPAWLRTHAMNAPVSGRSRARSDARIQNARVDFGVA